MPEKEVSLSPTAYDKWLEQEGLPVIKGYYVEDLRTVTLAPWRRKGGLGAYINLKGAEEQYGSYLCEIPPAGSLKPQRHLFEEMIYVLKGQGATTIWQEGGTKQSFEWQEGSLFAIPLNAWHQHFNGREKEPARYIGVTNAPLLTNIFHNLDFIHHNNFVFKDRYDGKADYFSGKGQSYPGRIWETNFVADVPSFQLQEMKKRGAGGTNIFYELAQNTMAAHVSEFPPGTYKKAHRHGPGAHVIILTGEGYSLIWPPGTPWKKIDWHPGSLFVPPEGWFHQHFNTGKEPARYLALRGGSQLYRVRKGWGVETSLKQGGDQIEYEDEDPRIRKLYEEELAKKGLKMKSGFLP